MTTIRATTFNAAAFDSKYKESVRPYYFMREHGSRQDLLLLQETKLRTEADVAAAKRRARKEGWNPHLTRARTTEAGKPHNSNF